MQRRQVLGSISSITATDAITGPAECMGDESFAETQESLDTGFMDLEATGQIFNFLQRSLENEDGMGVWRMPDRFAITCRVLNREPPTSKHWRVITV